MILTLLRYGIVALGSTGVEFATYAAIVYVFPASYVIANLWARLASLSAHFLLSRKFAFRVESQFRFDELVRYTIVVVLNVAAAMALVAWLVGRFGMQPINAKLVAQIALFFATFLLLRFFVYSRRQRQAERPG